MTELSKNIRTHIVQLTDWRELQITNEQYTSLKIKLEDSKFSDPLVIKDCDTEQIVFDWKVWAIKEFKHKTEESDYANSRRWICSYWWRHRLELQWECDCDKYFKCTKWVFRDKLKELWYEIFYDSDINESMRDHFLNS